MYISPTAGTRKMDVAAPSSRQEIFATGERFETSLSRPTLTPLPFLTSVP